MSGGHPYYTQLICSCMVDYLNQPGRSAPPTPDDLAAVVDAIVDNPPPQLVNAWSLTEGEQMALRLMGGRSSIQVRRSVSGLSEQLSARAGHRMVPAHRTSRRPWMLCGSASSSAVRPMATASSWICCDDGFAGAWQPALGACRSAALRGNICRSGTAAAATSASWPDDAGVTCVPAVLFQPEEADILAVGGG